MKANSCRKSMLKNKGAHFLPNLRFSVLGDFLLPGGPHISVLFRRRPWRLPFLKKFSLVKDLWSCSVSNNAYKIDFSVMRVDFGELLLFRLCLSPWLGFLWVHSTCYIEFSLRLCCKFYVWIKMLNIVPRLSTSKCIWPYMSFFLFIKMLHIFLIILLHSFCICCSLSLRGKCL